MFLPPSTLLLQVLQIAYRIQKYVSRISPSLSHISKHDGAYFGFLDGWAQGVDWVVEVVMD